VERKRRSAGELRGGWGLGDVLDFIDTRTQQPGRSQQRYQAPIIRSGSAMRESVIITATSGAALECSIETPQRNRRTDRVLKEGSNIMSQTATPTPTQATWNMPLGIAMGRFFGGATSTDFALKNELYNRLGKALNNPPAGVTGRHLAMAVLDLARDVVEAQVKHDGAQ